MTKSPDWLTPLGWLAVIALMLGYYALLGVVFADLWRLAVVPLGLPRITALQAAIALLALGMLGAVKRNDRTAGEAAIDIVARMVGILATWGAAYLLVWAMGGAQ